MPANDSMASLQNSKLRTELIETKAIVIQLRNEIEKKSREHKEAILLAENKSTALKDQCDITSKKNLELQDDLKALRKRELVLKNEASRATAELNQLRLKFDESTLKLQKEKYLQKEDARDVHLCINNELSEYRRIAQRADLELQSTRNELERLRQLNEELQARASGFEQLRANHEKQTQSLKVANDRIQELEFEIQSYSDWKEVVKTSRERLASVPDLLAEVEHLRSHNKHLNTLIGDKLLLEEQVYDYKTRLEREEGARAEAASLQVKLLHMEQELKEWVKVAQDHCLANTLVSPMALRSRIEQLLKEDIIHVAEKTSSASDTKHLNVGFVQCVPSPIYLTPFYRPQFEI